MNETLASIPSNIRETTEQWLLYGKGARIHHIVIRCPLQFRLMVSASA